MMLHRGAIRLHLTPKNIQKFFQIVFEGGWSETLFGFSTGSTTEFLQGFYSRIGIEIFWCPEEGLNLHDQAITSTLLPRYTPPLSIEFSLLFKNLLQLTMQEIGLCPKFLISYNYNSS